MWPFVCAGVARGKRNGLVSSGGGVQTHPPAPAFSRSYQVRPADSGRYPSGQRGQTVNLLAYAFGGSNPPPHHCSGYLEVGFHRGWAEQGATTRGTRGSAVESVRGAAIETRLRKAHVVLRSGGNSSAVERQPSKLGVAGSNPVSRSRSRECAHVAQSAERVLGKDEVSGSIPDMGSRIVATANGRA